MEEGERNELHGLLGHRFTDPRHLEHALTHRSQRQGSIDFDNERLEFLGDRVVGLVASEQLFLRFPQWNAGHLSKALARLVSAASLFASGQRLGLGRYLRLGRGEEKTGGREKKRLIVDAYEAALGRGVSPDTVATAAVSSALGLMVQIHGEDAVAKMVEDLPEKIRAGTFTHQS